MKRRIQQAIYREIEHLSDEDRTEYFVRGAEEGPLGEFW
jgi:hypothetical protein